VWKQLNRAAHARRSTKALTGSGGGAVKVETDGHPRLAPVIDKVKEATRRTRA